MAGHFATKIKAKKLILTHFSQRYKGVNDNIDDSDSVEKLLKQAEGAFKSGSVVTAEDFLVIQLPMKHKD